MNSIYFPEKCIDVPIPPMFTGSFGRGTGAQSPVNTSARYNHHMYDGNPRKASDYAYSSSPMRGTTSKGHLCE